MGVIKRYFDSSAKTKKICESECDTFLPCLIQLIRILYH
jgi:hypothetical protein